MNCTACERLEEYTTAIEHMIFNAPSLETLKLLPYSFLTNKVTAAKCVTLKLRHDNHSCHAPSDNIIIRLLFFFTFTPLFHLHKLTFHYISFLASFYFCPVTHISLFRVAHGPLSSSFPLRRLRLRLEIISFTPPSLRDKLLYHRRQCHRKRNESAQI